MRLCWADKIALTWGALLFGFIFLMQQPGGFYTMFFTAYGWSAGTGPLIFKLILLPWLLLRGLDLLTGGPARRRGIPRVTVLPPGY